MKPITVIAPYSAEPLFEQNVRSMADFSLVERVVVVSPEPGVHPPFKDANIQLFVRGPMASQETLELLISDVQTDFLLLLPESGPVSWTPDGAERLLTEARAVRSGIAYSDFYEDRAGQTAPCPVNDYQPGSVRDDFDFGSAMLFSVPAVKNAVENRRLVSGTRWAGLYDLRLKVSIDHSVHHVKHFAYTVTPHKAAAGEQRLFAYVDQRNATVQREMELVFTDYLKKIDAYLPPDPCMHIGRGSSPFPVEASVIIPVHNRRETIGDAVRSALSQEADFPFNIIVVDNYSTDGTTSVLFDLARAHSKVKHYVPVRSDLEIGGCWNKALKSEACGRYAVQLDSDDLYEGTHVLQRIVDELRQSGCPMVIGAYTVVDSDLQEIPPGLVDHREWTDENGRNNALRVNGLGAPRAFNTTLMRQIEFQNVSYGEDYAAALRVCREFRIARIYESLYLARRWSGNSDSGLSRDRANRNDAFKDSVRTAEIEARQKMNRGG
jgi:hypothetical protein